MVPSARFARAAGLDLPAAGLQPVATPRHAGVLVVVGPLPGGLAQAAAVAYAQMPRPRALLAFGGEAPAPLPAADVMVSLDQDALIEGVARLRDWFRDGAWAVDSSSFTGVAVGSANGDDQSMDHGGMDHGSMDHGDMDHGSMDDGDMDHGEMDHGSMDHGEMDHGGGGFMSMVAMTKDLPRGPDGLPMETVTTPFGPLFPGLPAGLGVTFTLDGDVVTEVEVTPGMVDRHLEATWPGPVAGFADRLTALDPLSPVSYRVLAECALLAIGAPTSAGESDPAFVAMLERERVASHLSWVAEFAALLGARFLADRAAKLHLAVHREPVGRVAPRVRAFLGDVTRTPLLQRRLTGIADLDDAELDTLAGPVARADGLAVDARTDDPLYDALGFAPVVTTGGDALARLQVRLAEIEQSLDLLQRLPALADGLAPAPHPSPTFGDSRGIPTDPGLRGGLSGSGTAVVETPRGTARLELTVNGGQVTAVRLDDHARHHASLIPAVARGAEVADALVGIASLDLSPWAIDR